ncbi:hypothetical protein [Halosimplex sp. TS25]|uniref:hypothetical protein n=1 Tax=Halosimplex rarum TaxID=3396619 RepID=UPI0039ECE80E
MDDGPALRRTLRRCTAALIVTLTPALRPISDYQYDGTLAFAIALGYLVVSATAQFDVLTGRSEAGGGPTTDDASDAGKDGETDADSDTAPEADGERL